MLLAAVCAHALILWAGLAITCMTLHDCAYAKIKMSAKKFSRKALCLKKKCELIDVAKKNPQLSSRTLAKKVWMW